MALRTGTPLSTSETDRYAEFGRAAIIPGIVKAIEALNELLNTIRIEIAASQGRASGLPVVKHQTAKRAKKLAKELVGTVEKLAKQPVGRGSYWASMTAEERRVEMARRAKVRAKNAARLEKVA